jgi:ABC-2 type transport system permease protein
MRYARLMVQFIRASAQSEVAHRANFWISLLHSLLNLATGVLGVVVLFGQIDAIRGWDFPSTLALLGVYLTVGALQALFIAPSLDALAGMEGEIHNGQFDFTLLRPVDTQFLASFRHWRPLALIDLALGVGVLVTAVIQLEQSVTVAQLAVFLAALSAGMTIIYAILLAFTGLIFWSPGFYFTWVFNALFQLARYPVNLYPGWLRLALTWVLPVAFMTTVPAQALLGVGSTPMLIASLVLAFVFLAGASAVFRVGLRQYASVSS